MSVRNTEVQQFAAGFGFALCTVFAYPLITSWVLGVDRSVGFWFGRYMLYWTVPIPLGFLLVILLQLRLAQPKRSLLIFTFVIPTCIFFLTAASMSSNSVHLSDRLASVDCRTFASMRPIAQSYALAWEKYDECNAGRNESRLALPQCENYGTWLKEEDNARIWGYLQFLETNFECSGFCKPADRLLWTLGEAPYSRDSCAVAIISVMRSKVSRLTTQLMIYPLAALFCFLIWLYSTRTSIAAYFRERRHLEKQLRAELGVDKPPMIPSGPPAFAAAPGPAGGPPPMMGPPPGFVPAGLGPPPSMPPSAPPTMPPSPPLGGPPADPLLRSGVQA